MYSDCNCPIGLNSIKGYNPLQIYSDRKDSDIALIDPKSEYNFPDQCNKINSNLYFAGGKSEEFKARQLEIFGISLQR